MRENNPMFKDIPKSKRLETIKRKYPNWGQFNIGIKRPDLVKRNKVNNPMKNPDIKPKAIQNHSNALKEIYKDINERVKFNRRMFGHQRKRPTKPERIFMNLIIENNLLFEYGGDGSICIGGFFPDFINQKDKLIIEIDGDYWHSLPGIVEKDKRKFKEYERQGYKVLVIKDYELKNLDQTIKKVNKFYLK